MIKGSVQLSAHTTRLLISNTDIPERYTAAAFELALLRRAVFC